LETSLLQEFLPELLLEHFKTVAKPSNPVNANLFDFFRFKWVF
jgi:hypothetical protein